MDTLKMTEEEKQLWESVCGDRSPRDWYDWKWHINHTIKDIATAEDLLGIEIAGEDRIKLEKTLDKFPLSITPYYLSLVDPENVENDPVWMQAFPSVHEMDTARCETSDPLHEDADSPAPGITHRYPDRVLFHVSNMCAMYCRHCTRKRKVGDQDYIPARDQIEEGLEYIRRTPQVRDVLLSGGDPFLLSDERIDDLLGKLQAIPHVEVVRIGTRTPVVLPFRITDDLIAILKKHKPLWINTHFNHPRELTEPARLALDKISDAGIPLGNQTVLLAGVNDCPRIMKRLVQKLVRNRVRPYYMYQCDMSEGLMHFRTPIAKGIEIIENLIGHTSGFAVPTYVVDAPGGGGKIPVMPNYIVTWSTNKVVLRNYEGVYSTYKEPESYEARFCDRDCEKCDLFLNMEESHQPARIGISKLLADDAKDISLIPEGNPRMARRKDDQDGRA